MSKILILSKNLDRNNHIAILLNNIGYEVFFASKEQEAIEILNKFLPDIALIDTSDLNINLSNICKELKLQSNTSEIQIILLTSKDFSSNEVIGADGYITEPFDDSILIATVNAHLRIKKLLEILSKNNIELTRSLYQLDTLYTISSQLAGTLDKSKLINIMTTGLKMTLDFSLCLTLLVENSENINLIINSPTEISENLEQEIKTRIVRKYEDLAINKNLPFKLIKLDIDDIKVVKYGENKEIQSEVNILDFDSLFSTINTSDRFFGTVEVLRKIKFAPEDITCFKTIVKQVSLPLESAILYDEIQETNKKLERLEKLKSEFVSIVSHELRTPLTAIQNSLDIMLSGKTGNMSDSENKFLNIAKRNTERLSGIINDLLDLSKIEAGKMQYNMTSIDIKDPIQFTISTFSSLANNKNIQLSCNIPDNLPKIWGDIDKIEQILSNLISNAIKFTDEKGKIDISAEKTSIENIKKYIALSEIDILDNDYVKITVMDTGLGIAEEDISKVFDKFQQIENSLIRKVGGTGLGLPIARQLVRAHKGDIWVESELNKGSKFLFILPITK